MPSGQYASALFSQIIRLEGQVKRFKTIAESAEMQEDQLKQERRKIHREVSSRLDSLLTLN